MEIQKHIQKAVDVLLDGGIIIYPTDTAFGIGCCIDNERAVDRLFALRRRKRTHAVPVLINSIKQAEVYFTAFSNNVRRLMETYWPGALTIVYTCHKDLLYSPIRGGGSTIGLRIPDHTVIRELITRVRVPIAGCSANFHKRPTVFDMNNLDPELIQKADYVVPGICTHRSASTVVDCTKEPFNVLRKGVVTL